MISHVFFIRSIVPAFKSWKNTNMKAHNKEFSIFSLIESDEIIFIWMYDKLWQMQGKEQEMYFGILGQRHFLKKISLYFIKD